MDEPSRMRTLTLLMEEPVSTLLLVLDVCGLVDVASKLTFQFNCTPSKYFSTGTLSMANAGTFLLVSILGHFELQNC